ncbi:virion structural protein [Klebsiella phage VLCpiA1c]|nr:virion structural protein [Klebsiella phage VLCpiA1c]
MSGGLGNILGKATDMLGLTDNAGLEAQQRLAQQQADAAKQQAALEANSAADNIAEIDPSGAASASADAITSEQKKRRQAGQSNPLGL